MPVLHIQFSGQKRNSDGTTTPVPANLALISRGPSAQVTVSVAQSVAEQLVQQGQPVPQPVSGWALIDTGFN